MATLRTSAPLVIEQLARNYDGKTTVTPFIRSANVLTTNVATLATNKGVTLDSDTLAQMECLLACHFYQRHDPDFNSKTTGKSAASFRGSSGLRLDGTTYGQDAMAMDFSGCLSALNKGGRISLVWLGKPPSDQIPYVDRD